MTTQTKTKPKIPRLRSGQVPRQARGKKKKAETIARTPLGVRVKKTARKTAYRVKSSWYVLDLRLRERVVSPAPVRVRAPKQQHRRVLSPFVKAAPHILLKVLAVVLIVSMNGAGLSSIGYTAALYTDIETSSDNTFEAGIVDFTLTSTEWDPYQVSLNMEPGTSTGKTFTIYEGASNPFQYFASTTLIGGDVPFCDGIEVALTQESGTLFTGSLSELLSATTTSTTTLALSATTGLNSFQNSVCSLELDFNGWQVRHSYPPIGGFNDTEQATTTLSSWGFRLNKVYYDVESPERGKEGDNEWVEVYNQTDTPLDISAWEICDNTFCDVIPSDTPTVPAQGYAMITNSSGTASATGTAPWYLPPGVVYIPLGENIGNGLNNQADMLVLKRPDGVVVDQMNYGTPDTGWPNYAAYQSGIWDPGAPDVAEGNLLARVPSGYDTDEASDWHEIAPPLLDLIYPDEDASYFWYWGYTYTIRWLATNPNGPNNALSIALFYILDTDHTYSITPGDTTHTITLATDNDGVYKWKVPNGFIGYIWIKLVATGPENPLNNTQTASGKIYDPEPIFIGPEGITPEDIDLIPPVITLLGDNPTLLPLGATFDDPGADVTDNVSENLSYATHGEVDTSVLGEYSIAYTAFDEMGNTATSTRAVIVYDPESGPPTEEPTPDPLIDESALETVEGAELASIEESFLGSEEGTTTESVAGGGDQQAPSVPVTVPVEVLETQLTTDATVPDEEVESVAVEDTGEPDDEVQGKSGTIDAPVEDEAPESTISATEAEAVILEEPEIVVEEGSAPVESAPTEISSEEPVTVEQPVAVETAPEPLPEI